MKKALLFIFAMIMLMIPMSVLAQNEDSNLSITPSVSEVAAGEEFSLRIDAPGAEAVRVWNDKNERLKELHLPKGGGSISLKFTVDEPGTAVYYLTASYNGSWSDKPSAKAAVTVKGPQDSADPLSEPKVNTPEQETASPDAEEDSESSLSITASKSEVMIGEAFELEIKASGADAVRLWDGKTNKQLREFPFSGLGSYKLSVSVPLPGTSVYYLTAAYNGVWSEIRSSSVKIRVKAQQNTGVPNVIPAAGEADFLGTWHTKYAGFSDESGNYQISKLTVENDLPFRFSPGFLTVGENASYSAKFEDGILFTDNGAFELTDVGYLSWRQDNGIVAYLEKTGDDYPAEPLISETAAAENEQKEADQPEVYTGRSVTEKMPEAVPAAGENEFLGTWELCYAIVPGHDMLIDTALLGPESEAYFYIDSGTAKYSTPSNHSSHNYDSQFTEGVLDLGTSQLKMNDNGMISQKIGDYTLYFCRIGGPSGETAGSSDGSASNASDGFTLTVTPTEGVAGQKLHFYAEAPGADSITLFIYGTSRIREMEGDVFDFEYQCLNYGDVEFSAMASYNGGSAKKVSNKVSVRLEQKTSDGNVYKYLDEVNLAAADKFSVDIPSVVGTNETFRVTINPQIGIGNYMVSLIEKKGNPLFLDEVLKAGTLEFAPLPAGSYFFTVIANGGSYDYLDVNFEVVEGVNTEAARRFTVGSDSGNSIVGDSPEGSAQNETEKPKGEYAVNPDAAEADFPGTWYLVNLAVPGDDGKNHLYGFDSKEPIIMVIDSEQAVLQGNPPSSVSTSYKDGRLYFEGNFLDITDDYFEMTYGGHLFLTDKNNDFVWIWDKTESEGDPSEAQVIADIATQGAAAFNELQKGAAYYNGDGVEQDYEQAVYWFTQAAEHGNPQAMHNLGIIYSTGEGAGQDYEKAAYWYQKAAESGNSASQTNLGILYENGFGVAQDYEQAVYWYQKAAEQGDVPGQTALGFMYESGHGVEQDYEQAAYWYQKAAEQGDARGQTNLGIILMNGPDAEQNYEQAVYWYQKAAEQGLAAAQNNLGFMYFNGYGVEQDYRQALYWYQQAADQEYSLALNNLGNMYRYGYGIEQDPEQAVYWFQKAADQDYAPAQTNLGYMYDIGEGVEQSYEKAAYWYQKSADAGFAPGQNGLAGLYFFGHGVRQDYARTAYWTQKAADQGDAQAQVNLGDMYENGYGVEQQDYEKALYWYQKAADQGYMVGQYNLGYLYETGKGVEQDPEQAEYWFQKAADQGYDHAVTALEGLRSNIRLILSHTTLEAGKMLTVSVSAPGADRIRLYDSLSSDPDQIRKEVEGDTLEYRRISVRSSDESYWAEASYNGVWSSEMSSRETVTFIPASRLRVSCPESVSAEESFKITIYEVENTTEYEVRIFDESESLVRELTTAEGTVMIDPIPVGKYKLSVSGAGDESHTMTFLIEAS